MPAKNMLICFDAFGTLFAPKRPVIQQYAEVARSLGLTGFSDERLGAAFKQAYKHESNQHPNYGHATGLGSEKWWTNIIHNTFHEVIAPTQTLPHELVLKLLHRFWSDEGYVLSPDVRTVLQKLRACASASNIRVVIGVITNSDDRVPDILRSLSLRVSPLRFGQRSASRSVTESRADDIDFVVMSYDVGVEKPDKRIFDAAVQTLDSVLVDQGERLPDNWRRIYVGDEYAKDVVGAIRAGWEAVLIDGEKMTQHDDLFWPADENDERTLFELFHESPALAFSSFKSLAKRIE